MAVGAWTVTAMMETSDRREIFRKRGTITLKARKHQPGAARGGERAYYRLPR